VEKNMVEPDVPEYNRAHFHCVLDTYGYRQTLRILIYICIVRGKNGYTITPQYYIRHT